MSNYLNLVSAIKQYQTQHPTDPNFQKLGGGKFYQWKVQVLLYNTKNHTWKFEEVNLLQRILWKIAKLLPCLKITYEKVSLTNIHAALEKEVQNVPEAQALKERIETLWKKKTNSQSEEATQSPNVLLQDSQWLAVKGAHFSNENGYLKMHLKEKDLNLMLGNSNHGEYFAIRDFLKLSDEELGQLVTIIPENSGPDLMFKTQEGKIRIYKGGLAQDDQLFLYKEYENVEEAIHDYLQGSRLDFLIRLLRTKQALNVREPLKDDFFLMRNDYLKTYLTNNALTEAQRIFIANFFDKDIPINKEKDLQEINQLIADELSRQKAFVQ